MEPADATAISHHEREPADQATPRRPMRDRGPVTRRQRRGGAAVTPRDHRPAAALKHDPGNHQVGACASSRRASSQRDESKAGAVIREGVRSGVLQPVIRTTAQISPQTDLLALLVVRAIKNSPLPSRPGPSGPPSSCTRSTPSHAMAASRESRWFRRVSEASRGRPAAQARPGGVTPPRSRGAPSAAFTILGLGGSVESVLICGEVLLRSGS